MEEMLKYGGNVEMKYRGNVEMKRKDFMYLIWVMKTVKMLLQVKLIH